MLEFFNTLNINNFYTLVVFSEFININSFPLFQVSHVGFFTESPKKELKSILKPNLGLKFNSLRLSS